MKKWILIALLAIMLPITLAQLQKMPDSTIDVYAQQLVPFEKMKLGYYIETTQILKDRNGISANGWTRVMFHDLTASNSKMDLNVNGTIQIDNWQYPAKMEQTVDFPTNGDTLLFLRNGGQKTLTIYAGPTGFSIPELPGFTLDLTRTWTLHDETNVKTPFGSYPAYRYRTSIQSAPVPGGGTVDLTFYASFEKRTQVLAYGEIWATQGVFSALITKVELREANLQLPPTVSSRCVIATAAYGSELAAPVQFLREFRDREVQSTFAGRSFMTAFNRCYYAWAPPVAETIESQDGLRFIVRILIAPLVASLSIGDTVFTLLQPGLSAEAAILITGLVSSILIGTIYFVPIGFVIERLHKYSSTTD